MNLGSRDAQPGNQLGQFGSRPAVVVPPPPPPPAVVGPTLPVVAPPPVPVPSPEVRGVPPILSRQGRVVDSPPNVPVLGLFVAPRPDSTHVREHGSPAVTRRGQVRVGNGSLTVSPTAPQVRTPPAPVMVPAVVALDGSKVSARSAPIGLMVSSQLLIAGEHLRFSGRAGAYAWRPLTEDELLVALWHAFEDQG